MQKYPPFKLFSEYTGHIPQIQNFLESMEHVDFFRAQNNFSLLSLLQSEYKEQFGQIQRDEFSDESFGFFGIYFTKINYWI
jgi:hypothetical protein